MLLCGYDADRIRNSATVPRNQVEMRVGYGLSGHLSDIYSEIRAIGMNLSSTSAFASTTRPRSLGALAK
jgi:hypothetical protein